LDPELKCYLPGVPRATDMQYPFQTVQSENNILISFRAIYQTVTRHSSAIR
jgi:hypothetical protein